MAFSPPMGREVREAHIHNGPSSENSYMDGLTKELERIWDKFELERPHLRPPPHTETNEQQAKVNVLPNAVMKYKTCEDTGVNLEWDIMGYTGMGMGGGTTICSPPVSRSHGLTTCYIHNMESLSTVSSRREEWATCHPGYYISGFYHTYNIHQGNNNLSGLISGVECCAGDYTFIAGPDGPVVEPGGEDCHEMKWWDYATYIVQEGWFTCPRGMLLKAMRVTAKRFQRNNNVITMVRCCKPKQSPKEYMACYTTNSTSVSDTGVHACHREGFQIAGLFRKNCNEYGIHCEEDITCCMMG
jgi:hypothetical protein